MFDVGLEYSTHTFFLFSFLFSLSFFFSFLSTRTEWPDSISTSMVPTRATFYPLEIASHHSVHSSRNLFFCTQDFFFFVTVCVIVCLSLPLLQWAFSCGESEERKIFCIFLVVLLGYRYDWYDLFATHWRRFSFIGFFAVLFWVWGTKGILSFFFLCSSVLLFSSLSFPFVVVAGWLIGPHFTMCISLRE